MSRHEIVFVASLLMTVIPHGFADNPMAAAQIVEATSVQEPESVLPQSGDLHGWQMDGDIEIYMPENLYEYIDGAAEGYLDYGFRKLATSRYVRNGTEADEITVDVYDMDVPLQGFGIYACERSTDDRFIQLGGQGHISETALDFWQGKFYVKMVFFGRSESPENLLLDLATPISARIEGNPPQPEFFGVFPDWHRVRNTEQVFLKAPLGHTFLSPAYQVSYKGDERSAMLLVSVASKPSEATQRMEKYQEHLKKIEAPSSIAEGFPDGCVRVEDRYSGECVLGQCGRFVVFLIGKAQNGPKIMAELWKNLQSRQQAESSASTSQG
jgi:hypothetical protein